MEAYENRKPLWKCQSWIADAARHLQNRLELLFQNPNATIIDESENISESLSEVRNMRLLTSNLLNMARQDNNIKINPEATDKEFFEAILVTTTFWQKALKSHLKLL